MKGDNGLFKVTLYALFNMVSSVAIVFVNKSVFRDHGFNFPVTLTFAHSAATWAGMEILSVSGFFVSKASNENRRQTLIISASFVGFVVLTNLSLQLNSVGFYQVAKILTTPAVVFIQIMFYAKEFHANIKFSLIPVCLGVMLATAGEIEISVVGTIVAFSGTLVTSIYQIVAGTKQKVLGLSSMQLIHVHSPWSTGLLFACIPMLESTGIMVPAPDSSTLLGYTYTRSGMYTLTLSTVLGFFVNWSTFLIIGATSPLTYNIVGHCKTVLIVAGGCIFLGESVNVTKIVGVFIAVCGIMWYTQINMHLHTAQGLSSNLKQDYIIREDTIKFAEEQEV